METNTAAVATQPSLEVIRVEPATPVSDSERINSVDTLRGVALLGILLMNIVGFGLYYQAYNNPTAAGGASGANLWTWVILRIAAEGKMRALFSLVFGASMILLTERLAARPDGADIYYRRTLWLLAFGCAHSYLLWQGDILYPYAICGLALYPFRKLNAKWLLGIGLACLLIVSAFCTLEGVLKKTEKAEALAASAKLEKQLQLTDAEKSAKEDWDKFLETRNPSAETLKENAKKWQGGFIDVIKERGKLVNQFNGIQYYHPYNMDMWGMMFIGMALLKLGILHAKKSARFYFTLMAVGYLVGCGIDSVSTWILVRARFDPIVQMYSFGSYDIARLATALGHLGLVMLLCRQAWLPGLSHALGAVGRLALSNYILTSVLCAFIFTGYGLGLYGRLERHQLYLVVAAIWILQLVLSPLWLKRYRFGPCEWVWRSLTYLKRTPIRLPKA